MASFKKFKIGNTSYDVKDANAGYSLSISGSNLSLKNSAGTAISTVTVSGGGSMDYEIIAKDFGDLEPGSSYSQYDIVKYNNEYYVSAINNNTGTPDLSSNIWKTALQSPVTLPGWVNEWAFVERNGSYYINTGAGVYVSSTDIPSNFVLGTYKGDWVQPQSSGYSVGDYCIYNDKLYKCKTANAGTTWNAAEWEETIIMDEVKDAKTSVSFSNLYPSTGYRIATITVNDASQDLYIPRTKNPLQVILRTTDSFNVILQNAASTAQTFNLLTTINKTDFNNACIDGVPIYVCTSASGFERIDLIEISKVAESGQFIAYYWYIDGQSGDVVNKAYLANISFTGTSTQYNSVTIEKLVDLA